MSKIEFRQYVVHPGTYDEERYELDFIYVDGWHAGALYYNEDADVVIMRGPRGKMKRIWPEVIMTEMKKAAAQRLAELASEGKLGPPLTHKTRRIWAAPTDTQGVKPSSEPEPGDTGT